MRSVLEGEESQFSELLSIRKLRKKLFPRVYDYEARVEQIEGTANYVELLAAVLPIDSEAAFTNLSALFKLGRFISCRQVFIRPATPAVTTFWGVE